MNRRERRARGIKPSPRTYFHFSPTTKDAILDNAAAFDAVSDGDRDWFKANPDRVYRLREISEAERATCPGKPPGSSGLCSYIVVRQIRPGVRARVGFDAYPLHRPERFSDSACAKIFDEIKQQRTEVCEAIETLSKIEGRS